MIGQDLLERGFPRDAASSQVVLVYERKGDKLTDADLAYVEREAAGLYKYAETDAEPRPEEDRHPPDPGRRPPARQRRPPRRRGRRS